MKILFLSTDFKPRPGGIAELSYHVCAELAARGHEIEVLTLQAEGLPDAAPMNGFTVRRPITPCPSSMRTPVGAMRAMRWAARTRRMILQHARDMSPDLVFAGNYHEYLWPQIVRRVGRPFVAFLHGEEVGYALISWVPGRRGRMRRLVRGAAWTFCNSSYTLSLIERLCVGGESSAARAAASLRASAVGCGFPVEQIVPESDRRSVRAALGWPDVPTLLTVCRLVPRKGVDTTLRALPLILHRRPEARYVVVGDGPQADVLRSMARDMGLESHVAFLGYVDEAVKRQAYLAADVFVMPSRSNEFGQVEGFGITFLEANAHGLPAVGTNVGGIPDAVEHGVNGLLAPPDDPPALAEAILRLLDHPEESRRMAQAGQQRIRERFNWRSIVEEMERHLIEARGTRCG